MTDDHQAHIKHLVRTFSDLAKKKYRIGQQEHGGALWQYDTLTLLRFAREEMIDGFIYLQTIIDQLEKESDD